MMGDQKEDREKTVSDHLDHVPHGATNEKLSPSVYIIFIFLIVDLLGFTVILPLFPSIFQFYDSNEKDHLYHWMQNQVRDLQRVLGTPDGFNKVLFGGLLGSLFSTLQFLVAPIFGSLSDVYGRKPILIITMVGIAISHAVWCISDCFYLFVIARIIGGLSRANISVSTAVVTDLCSEKTRGKGMAFIGIAFAVGFIVGPMIGAVFASVGSKSSTTFFFYPAVFALAMALMDIALLVFCFKESLPQDKRAPSIGQGLSKAYEFISPVSLFSFSPVQNMESKEKESLKLIGLIYFLFLFIYSGLEYSLSFLTHIRFAFSSMDQGKMYLFSGLIMIVVQGGYVRRIPPGKEINTAVLGAILIIPGFILIGVATNVVVLFIGFAFYAIASATVVPCLTTIVSKFGSHSEKGIVLGIFRSLGSLARAFGPMVFALAFWSLTPTVTYCIGAALLTIPLLLIISLQWRLSPLQLKQD